MTDITQEYIQTLIETNSGLKLLHARNAGTIITFLYQVFGNLDETSMEQDRFLALLENYFAANDIASDDLELQDQNDLGLDNKVKARAAVNTWCQKGYLLRSYNESVQEIITLSAGVNRLFRYLEDIDNSTKGIVGTDSRFSAILYQINELKEKTTEDPLERIKGLKAKQQALQDEIRAIEERGTAQTFTPVQIQERVEELERQCRALLSDFRQLKDNNHKLFLQICKKQLEATDSRGDILQYTMEGQSAISNSPQGQSFDAFWGYLTMEDEENTLYQQIRDMELRIQELNMDWDFSFLKSLEDRLYNEGRSVNEENHMLSSRLRRILLRYASGEYQQMQELSREVKALSATLESVPKGTWMEADGKLTLDTTFSRPLVLPPVKLPHSVTNYEEQEASSDSILDQVFAEQSISTTTLRDHIDSLRKQYATFSISTIIERYPLQFGLEELLKYLTMVMRMDSDQKSVDPYDEEKILFLSYPDGRPTVATIPKVIIYGEN